MVRNFAGGGTAVVATRAHRGRREQTVVRLGTQPGAGRLVAVLAHRLATVDGGGRAAAQAIAGAQVAGRALGGQRHIGMELPRAPAGIARFVAAVAVGDGYSAQRLVGNMVHRLAVCGWVGPAVAGGTLVGHRHLAVVPFAGLPAGHAVAAHTVHRCRNVVRNFAGGGTAVVATRAHRGRREQTVVRLGTQPGAGRLVAVLAHRLATVDGGGWPTAQAKTGAQVAGRALGGQRHIGVKLPRAPAGVARFVAAVAIGDGNTTQ